MMSGTVLQVVGNNFFYQNDSELPEMDFKHNF